MEQHTYLEVGERVGAALHQEAGVEEVVQLGVPCLLVVEEAAAVALPFQPVDLAVAGEEVAVVQVLTTFCLGLQLERVAGVVGGEGQVLTGICEEHRGVVVGEAGVLVWNGLWPQSAVEEAAGMPRALQQRW